VGSEQVSQKKRTVGGKKKKAEGGLHVNWSKVHEAVVCALHKSNRRRLPAGRKYRGTWKKKGKSTAKELNALIRKRRGPSSNNEFGSKKGTFWGGGRCLPAKKLPWHKRRQV